MVGDVGLATDLTTRLTERMVDFGSAMNLELAGGDGVVNKFLSALSGEVEPLRRFGLDLSVKSLEDFAKQKGIGKAIKDMSQGEKAQLRFNFLMEKTAQFQGDAANTSEDFANSSRALIAKVGDLTTRIGMKFLPAAERMIQTTIGVVDTLGTWVEQSSIIQAALIVFGAIGTAVALRMAAAWALANLPILLAGAALAALVLIVDDFMTFLAGGDSVIGAFIESIFGPGSAAEAATNLKMAFEGLVALWTQQVLPTAQFVGEGSSTFFGNAFDAMGESLIANEGLWVSWSEGVSDILAAAGDAIATAARAIDDALGFVFDNLIADFKWLWDTLGKTERFLAGFAKNLGVVFPEIGQAADAITPGAGVQRGVRGLSGASAPPSVANPGYAFGARQAPAAAQTVTQSVSVTVEGNATPETARRVATDTADAMGALNRRTRAALTQRAAG